MAERLGVTRQSVSKWETDGSIPELDKLVRYRALFGVTLDNWSKERGRSLQRPIAQRRLPRLSGAGPAAFPGNRLRTGCSARSAFWAGDWQSGASGDVSTVPGSP